MDNNEIDKKRIQITGQNNKYHVKKLIQEKKEKKKRVISENWKLENEMFTDKKQYELLNEYINQNYQTNDSNTKLLLSEIQKKIGSYKQQDVHKKVLETEKFIQLNHVVDTLVDCDLLCYYCKEPMLMLYQLVRENKQWTIDRINNDLGHNQDNYVLSCLECNLKRRCRTKEHFLFTKQLNIVKQN